MDAGPDLAGFVEAQQRLRDKFGRVVTFYKPSPEQWPAGVPLDPQTGQPFDPTIRPASGGAPASASARASVVFQPLSAIRRDTTQEDATGTRSRLNLDLILDIADFGIVDGAESFELDGQRWWISSTKFDGIGSLQRVVVFGQAEK